MANTKLELWLEGVNEKFEKEWYAPKSDGSVTSLEYKPITYRKGTKFVKLIRGNSVWGFVSMFDGIHKNSPVKVGDLLMAAGWRTPAKHSRGNIFDGSDKWNFYGPNYL